jgi:hypothetical protein
MTPTSPLRLTDAQLREVWQAALMVPVDLRGAFLERLALVLRGQGELGDGVVHRVAYEVARTVVWDSERVAS